MVKQVIEMACIPTDAQNNERHAVGGRPSSRSYIAWKACIDIQNNAETGKEEDLLYEELHVDDRPRGSCRGDGAACERQSALL